jgi:selenocysteine lyase/cysteine desulfurase
MHRFEYCECENTLISEGMTITVNGVEGRPLYLDAQATTPLDPRVLDAMLPYLTTLYGNPHSRTHAYGWESEKAVETARLVRNYFYVIFKYVCKYFYFG